MTKSEKEKKRKKTSVFSPAAQRCQNFHFVCSLAGGRGEKEAEGKSREWCLKRRLSCAGWRLVKKTVAFRGAHTSSKDSTNYSNVWHTVGTSLNHCLRHILVVVAGFLVLFVTVQQAGKTNPPVKHIWIHRIWFFHKILFYFYLYQNVMGFSLAYLSCPRRDKMGKKSSYWKAKEEDEEQRCKREIKKEVVWIVGEKEWKMGRNNIHGNMQCCFYSFTIVKAFTRICLVETFFMS